MSACRSCRGTGPAQHRDRIRGAQAQTRRALGGAKRPDLSGATHAYLGHFRNAPYAKAGHNTNGRYGIGALQRRALRDQAFATEHPVIAAQANRRRDQWVARQALKNAPAAQRATLRTALTEASAQTKANLAAARQDPNARRLERQAAMAGRRAARQTVRADRRLVRSFGR